MVAPAKINDEIAFLLAILVGIYTYKNGVMDSAFLLPLAKEYQVYIPDTPYPEDDFESKD